MKKELTVLVTGGGAPGIAGTIHCLRANPEKRKIRVVACDMRGDAVGRYLADAFHTVPLPTAEEFVPAVLAICRSEGVDAILPQVTRELPLFAQAKEVFLREGIGVLVATKAAIERANDKHHVIATCDEIGVPCPAYMVVSRRSELEDAILRLDYPQRKVVVKATVSNGMRGLRILSAEPLDERRFLNEKPSGEAMRMEEFLRIFPRETVPTMLVTEYLPGLEYTVDVFRKGDVCEVVPRTRDFIRSGITFEGTVVKHDGLIDNATRLANALDMTGVFGFQFKLDAVGVPRILECNPRIQGTMVMSALAGKNLIYAAVKDLMEEDFLGVLAGPTSWGTRFKRFWGGVAINDGVVRI